jgi:alpha/beta superfamily hydrolase
LRVETVSFDSADNVKVHGELYLPDKAPAPAPGLIICHGFDRRGYRGYDIFTQLSQKVCENGFVSLVFDFRGCGQSTGQFDYGWGEQNDLKAAVDYIASRKDVMSDSIFVVGHSLGGAVAVYVAKGDKRIKGIALWSTPHDHAFNVKRFIIRERGRLGYYLFMLVSYIDTAANVSRWFSWRVYGIKLRPRYVRTKLMKLRESEVLKRLKGITILIVNGDGDQLTPLGEAKINYEAASAPKELVIIESAKHMFEDKEQQAIASHVFQGREEEAIQKTAAWLNKAKEHQ